MTIHHGIWSHPGTLNERCDSTGTRCFQIFERNKEKQYLKIAKRIFATPNPLPGIPFFFPHRRVDLWPVRRPSLRNIDSLHQRAGSKQVIEIHGTMATAAWENIDSSFFPQRGSGGTGGEWGVGVNTGGIDTYKVTHYSYGTMDLSIPSL